MQAKTAILALGTAVALAATLGVSSAHADNVYWSVGISQPGVHVGVSNAPPRPVYVPAPVVVAPQPVYYPPVVVQAPAPVYYPAPVVVPGRVVQTGWVPPGYWHRRHEWREWREHERFERRGWDRH